MTTTATTEQIAAALLVLKSLGVSPQDLSDNVSAASAVPTFGQYVPQVRDAMRPGLTRDHHIGYWNKLLELDGWADRPITEPTVTEFEIAIEKIKSSREIRRNGRGGHSIGQHFVAALRRLYRQAVNDGIIAPGSNPALRLTSPRQLPSRRGAISDEILAKIYKVAGSTGQDPDLDLLLIRLHHETACRPIGALTLRPMDLDQTQSLIRLREKGNTERWQPVSPTLMSALIRHAVERNAPHDGPLLRSKRGGPVHKGRYCGNAWPHKFPKYSYTA